MEGDTIAMAPSRSAAGAPWNGGGSSVGDGSC
jgi:hypothetical protein